MQEHPLYMSYSLLIHLIFKFLSLNSCIYVPLTCMRITIDQRIYISSLIYGML